MSDHVKFTQGVLSQVKKFNTNDNKLNKRMLAVFEAFTIINQLSYTDIQRISY
jgi:hypothetical protein